MYRRISLELLEDRRVLASTFSQQVIDLPLEDRVGRVMEVFDLNEDAKVDLVVGTRSTVDVLIGDGNQNFSLAASLPTDSFIQGLVRADLNGDQRDDLLVLAGNEILPLIDKGVTNGEWQGYRRGPAIAGGSYYKLASGKFDDDDFADIVYGVGRELKIRRGNGDGTFGASLSWVLDQADAHDFGIGDVNSDGFDDIVATAANWEPISFVDKGLIPTGPLEILTNDKLGAFERQTGHDLESPKVELFDYNRDGNLDLLVPTGDAAEEASTIFAGIGDGLFETSHSGVVLGSYRIENTAGDRIFTIRERDGHGAVIIGGLFLENTGRAIGMAPWKSGVTPHFADMDYDGTKEIVAISGDGLVVLQDVEASVLQVDKLRIPSPARDSSMAFGDDFDQDGYFDLLWLLKGNGTLEVGVQWGSAGGLGAVQKMAFEIGDTKVYFREGLYPGSDANQDGFPDIAFDKSRTIVDVGDGDAVLVELHGSADRTFAVKVADEARTVNRKRTTATGDIDGDGLVDEVSTQDSSADAIVTVRKGDLAGYEAHGTSYVFSIGRNKGSWQNDSMLLGDVTGDGTLDVLYHYSNAAELVILPGVSPHLPGDVNRDGVVELTDLELLAPLAHDGADLLESGLRLDMTGDQQADINDLDHWVEIIAETKHGDVDLDGKVDFADFLKLSANFGSQLASWSQGDFNGDGEVSFDDFLFMSTNFGFDRSR